ncbi:MAG: O-acetyl-ADP-ribose deacetylase [Cyanobacteriota bacterium]|nr:O-acetyl-ADP-ribose deacetylase [Cyanobacteriota bacterium]
MVQNKIVAVEGDITQQTVDAIVNSANESLLPGSGVNGAIHKAAGFGLEEECSTLGICREGEAKITKGYRLPAQWVIHTVGPVWEGGSYGEAQTLARCYQSCLTLALSYGIKTIAFPSISTGVYGFPLEKAAQIAVREVRQFLDTQSDLKQVIFACFEPEVYEFYQKLQKYKEL